MAFNIKYTYLAIDQFTAVTKKINQSVDTTRQKLRGLSEDSAKWGKKMKSLGQDVTVWASLPAQIFGGLAIKTVRDFEASMNRVQAVTDSTREEYEKLRAEAVKLGASTVFSSSQVADAMFELGQAGMSTQEILRAIPSTLSLAAAGNLGMQEAAGIVSNVMKGFGATVEELPKYVDILAAVAAKSTANVSDLGIAMKYVGPIAKNMKISIQDTTAAIASLSNAGMESSMAGTGFRQILSSIAKPAKGLKKILRGMTIEKDGLIPVLEKIKAAGMSSGNAMKYFGDRGGPAILALVSQLDAMKAMSGELGNVSGFAEKMANTQMQGIVGAFNELSGAFESLQIALIDKDVQAIIVDIAMSLKSLANWISNLSPWMRHLIVLVLAVVAVLGPLMMLIGLVAMSVPALTAAVGALAVAFGILTGPVGLIMAAMFAVGWIMDWAYGKFEWFRSGVDAICIALAQDFQMLVDGYMALVSWIQKGADMVGSLNPGSWFDDDKDINMNKSIAAEDMRLDSKANVNINIQDPGKNVKSVEAKKTGDANLNLGLNMGEAY